MKLHALFVLTYCLLLSIMTYGIMDMVQIAQQTVK